MKAIELFILEKNVNISKMEIDLGLPEKSLKIKQRGIPKKHEEAIVRYLVENYGYSGDILLREEADVPVSMEKKRVWNDGVVPVWVDGIIRYRDSGNGLWKRLFDWQSYPDKDDSTKRRIKEDFLPITGELMSDEIGEHYIAKNGIKVYSFRGNFSKIE